jgi:hypothetical protein
MKRNALLIGNTGGLSGTGIDIERTHQFLKSPLGGQWHDSEITKLLNPSKKLVTESLNRMRGEWADYTFFLFTGHGCHEGQTVLSLNDNNEHMLETDLNGIADRQLSIFDCCRAVPQELQKSAMEMYASLSESANTTRQRYERRIMQAAKQHARLYSCSLGEVSLDTSEGALYLSYLLGAAKSIPPGSEVVTIEEAHSVARTNTINAANKLGNKQTPAAIQAKLPRDMQLILSIK